MDTTHTATTDHLTVAIEDVDTQIAALNSQIDQMRDRVDTLADARVQLVTARAAIAGSSSVPLPKPTEAPSRPNRAASKRNAPSRQAKQAGSKYDLAEVARIARAAAASGKPMGRAVFEQIPECPSVSSGGFLLSQARNAGHDVPGGRDAARKAATLDEPASIAGSTGPRNRPYVRPDADTVATMEREAGLA